MKNKKHKIYKRTIGPMFSLVEKPYNVLPVLYWYICRYDFKNKHWYRVIEYTTKYVDIAPGFEKPSEISKKCQYWMQAYSKLLTYIKDENYADHIQYIK
jgi:hypothetical protein